jgi:hypothetical protein
LSDIERIEDSKDKNQAFQYLRVALLISWQKK